MSYHLNRVVYACVLIFSIITIVASNSYSADVVFNEKLKEPEALKAQENFFKETREYYLTLKRIKEELNKEELTTDKDGLYENIYEINEEMLRLQKTVPQVVAAPQRTNYQIKPDDLSGDGSKTKPFTTADIQTIYLTKGLITHSESLTEVQKHNFHKGIRNPIKKHIHLEGRIKTSP